MRLPVWCDRLQAYCTSLRFDTRLRAPAWFVHAVNHPRIEHLVDGLRLFSLARAVDAGIAYYQQNALSTWARGPRFLLINLAASICDAFAIRVVGALRVDALCARPRGEARHLTTMGRRAWRSTLAPTPSLAL